MGEEYYLQPAGKQTFYHVLGFAMGIMAMGSQTWLGLEESGLPIIIHGIVVKIFAPICLASQMFYLYVNFSHLSFSTLGILFSIIPVTVLGNVKIVSGRMNSYVKVMENFRKEIHLYNYKDQDVYMREKLIEVERFSRLMAYFYTVFLILDWGLWIVVPILNNIKNMDSIRNKTMQLQTCFYMWMPFDYEYNFRNWVMIHILNTYLTAVGCTMITTFDTINYCVIFHLIGHIQNLKHKIKSNFIGDLDDDAVKKGLVDVIKYHSFVLRVFNEIEGAFGVNVSINYFHNLIGDSLLLYHLMVGEKGNKLMYGLLLLVFMGGLILMTFILEEIRRQTDDIPEVVYNMPWENMSISNQKIMLMILAKVQPTLEFKAAGGLRAGVDPTLAIIKSTFSYYVMLNSNM